ncbi:MAG: hypothetical protein HYV47_03265 [Candidatus Nealsonbacteria bacterium]|nr:hypothetical protein [Candidatus Nealsonbacteria bacterium]
MGRINESFLALDIGTEAVKVLVFERDNQTYHIWGAALEYFDESNPFNNDKVMVKMKEAIKQAGKTPKDILLVPPANILKNRIHFQSIVRDNPQKIISKKEEQDIIDCIRKQDAEVIEFEILDIKIDGYEIPKLIGYAGKNIEFRILVSFLPENYLDNLGLKFQKIINPVKKLAGIFVIGEGVFLDIGGKITQIYLVRNAKIEMIDDFEGGGMDFTRAISQTLGMSGRGARDFKERYSRGELTQLAEKKTKEILAIPAKEWSLKLKSKLQSMRGLIPSNFFIFGGGSQLPEIKELIVSDKAKVKFIYPKDFKNIIDNTGCVDNPQYTNLILSIYNDY